MRRPHPQRAAIVPALLAGLALLWALAGCERQAPPERQTAPAQAAGQAADPRPAGDAPSPLATPQGGDDRPVVLFLGDSLTAGHGLPADQAFPALIQKRLDAAGLDFRVVNAGVSGDTSAGGRARLDWLLKQRVDVMVLALGANDGLRGQSTEAMRANLADIIERAQARHITVVLAGMQMPSNYGADYTRAFREVFPHLAERYDLPFIPFLLDGVALHGDLNQADGIHPNAEGARIVADNVWKVLEPVLRRLSS